MPLPCPRGTVSQHGRSHEIGKRTTAHVPQKSHISKRSSPRCAHPYPDHCRVMSQSQATARTRAISSAQTSRPPKARSTPTKQSACVPRISCCLQPGDTGQSAGRNGEGSACDRRHLRCTLLLQLPCDACSAALCSSSSPFFVAYLYMPTVDVDVDASSTATAAAAARASRLALLVHAVGASLEPRLRRHKGTPARRHATRTATAPGQEHRR